MKKILKIAVSIIICLSLVFAVVGIYSMDKPRYVLAGENGIIYNLKSYGLKIQSIENETAGLQVGDIVVSINGNGVNCYGFLDDIIKNYQANADDEILVSFIRDGEIHNIKIGKDVELGIESFNYNSLESGYITMIDPEDYMYMTVQSLIANENPINIFFGFIMKSEYNYTRHHETTYSSTGEVIGTVIYAGEKGVYGYLEPFQYRKENLVEVAPRQKVLSGPATIEFKNSRDRIVRIDVEIECEEDGLTVRREDGTFEDINIPGVPIFQNDMLVAVFDYSSKEDYTIAKALYAMDVYEEMLTIK